MVGLSGILEQQDSDERAGGVGLQKCPGKDILVILQERYQIKII